MTEGVEIKIEPAASVTTKNSSLKETKKQGNVSDTGRRIILLLVKVAFFGVLVYVVFFVVFGVTRMKDYNIR